MLKTGVRGERKRNLTPFTYSPIRRLLPRRGGNVVTGKRRKPPPSPLQRGNVVTEKGKKN